MPTPPRASPDPAGGTAPPNTEARLSDEQLARAAGITLTVLSRLVRLGVVEPERPGAHDFAATTAHRLRRMVRLHHDLEVDFLGAAIIVDLVERLERVEAELARRHSGPA